jgi:hypothetical protein
LSHAPNPFCFGYFWEQFSNLFSGPGWTLIFLSIVGITGMHHHTQLLLVEMGSQELFAWAGLELQSSGSALSK